MQKVRNHLALLGIRVEDKVTGFAGVVDSVSFDLYGCIQAGVNPGLNKDDEQKDCRWFDVSRLTIKGTNPVMATPDFDFGAVADGKHGPAAKTMMHNH